MQLTLTLLQLLPLQSGTGKNGEWRKQDIIVETQEQYPHKICVSLWGDKIDSVALAVGQVLKVDFDVESREYNGRWYTDVKAWRIELAQSAQTAEAPEAYPPGIDPLPWDAPVEGASLGENDILPF